MTKWYIIVALVVVIGMGILLHVSAPKTAEAPVSDIANAQPTQVVSDYHDNIYLSKTSSTSITYMTDFAGVTLYVSSEDQSGVSNCIGACAAIWKPYTSGAVSQKQFPPGITVITRLDGTTQFAWQGKPLYYYSKDTGPGDINGDGKSGVWSIVKL